MWVIPNWLECRAFSTVEEARGYIKRRKQEEASPIYEIVHEE